MATKSDPFQARSRRGMTIAELEEFTQRARAQGHPPDVTVNVKVGWSTQIKSIWLKEEAAANDQAEPTVEVAHPEKTRTKRSAPSEQAIPAPVPERRTRRQVAQPSLAEIVASHTIEPLRDELDEQVEVPNEHYHVKAIRTIFAERAMPITDKGVTLEELTCVLVPEPWNEFDPNAVVVMIDSHQIGHLPAALAESYQPQLLLLARNRLLVSGVARIWAKREGRAVRARATLLIPEALALRGRR